MVSRKREVNGSKFGSQGMVRVAVQKLCLAIVFQAYSKCYYTKLGLIAKNNQYCTNPPPHKSTGQATKVTTAANAYNKQVIVFEIVIVCFDWW